MAAVRMPAKMKLIDLILRQGSPSTTLKRFIVRARTQTATHPAETWDKIAHDIWNTTGEPLVRETVINYARTFGIEPMRPMSQPEADDVVRDDDEFEPVEAQASM